MGYVFKKELENFVLTDLTTKPQKVNRAVKVGGENTIVLELANGKYVVARQINTEKWAFVTDKYSGWMKGFAIALNKLGALSNKALAELEEDAKRRDAECERKWATKDLLKSADKLGIKLTKSQLEKIEAPEVTGNE